MSVFTVLLLLHTAFYIVPGFEEPSGFWTLLDVMTSVVRLTFMSFSQFRTFRKFWASNSISGKGFYLVDSIDIEMKQWSEKKSLLFIKFTSNVDKENSFSCFGGINAISKCLSFQIHLHFLPTGSLSKLVLCYFIKEKLLRDFYCFLYSTFRYFGS